MSLLCKNLYQIAPFVIMVIGAHTPPQQSGAQRYDLLWFGSSRYHPRVSSSEGGGWWGETRGKSMVAPPAPPVPTPPHRRKQGCYNLLSWLSMKVRGRATRASVRLDLLPLTPTVYLLSAISLSLRLPVPLYFLLFIRRFTSSSRMPPPPTVALHHSCIKRTHCVSFVTPPVTAGSTVCARSSLLCSCL